MCGRYVAVRSSRDVSKQFSAADRAADENLAPNWNVSPTNRVLIVRESHTGDEPERVVSAARWGLVPRWAKDLKIGSRMFNARAETVATKPAFRSSFKRHRCLIPAEGWYEWRVKPGEKAKQPYFMTPQDGSLLAFAGLWEVWHNPQDDDDILMSATILTVPAVDTFSKVHDRMPLVISSEDWAAWLGETNDDPDDAKELLTRLYGEEQGKSLSQKMEFRPIGQAVGNTRNNTAELVDEVEAEGL